MRIIEFKDELIKILGEREEINCQISELDTKRRELNKSLGVTLEKINDAFDRLEKDNKIFYEKIKVYGHNAHVVRFEYYGELIEIKRDLAYRDAPSRINITRKQMI